MKTPARLKAVGLAFSLAAGLVLAANSAVAQALQQTESSDKLATIGMTPMPMSPDQLKAFISTEITKWVRLAKDANIQPE